MFSSANAFNLNKSSIRVNPFPHNDTVDTPGKQAFWKHWEKEELHVTSNFSFFHSVIYQFG